MLPAHSTCQYLLLPCMLTRTIPVFLAFLTPHFAVLVLVTDWPLNVASIMSALLHVPILVTLSHIISDQIISRGTALP
jgi:hypothetical protein